MDKEFIKLRLFSIEADGMTSRLFLDDDGLGWVAGKRDLVVDDLLGAVVFDRSPDIEIDIDVDVGFT